MDFDIIPKNLNEIDVTMLFVYITVVLTLILTLIYAL